MLGTGWSTSQSSSIPVRLGRETEGEQDGGDEAADR